MTGYEITYNLVERRREWSFTATEQALYHELGMLAIRSGKMQNFSVSNEELMFNLSISKPTLINARENLIKSKIISYKKGELNGSRKSFGKYSINDLRLKNLTTNDTTNDTTTHTTTHTTNDTLNINNNNNNFLLKKETKGKFDFAKILIQDFGCEKQHVEDWLKVRKAKRGANTETALKNFINECNKNAFPVSEAVRICAENSWQGFQYEWLINKNLNVNGNIKTGNQKKRGITDAELAAAVAGGFARAEFDKANR